MCINKECGTNKLYLQIINFENKNMQLIDCFNLKEEGAESEHEL